MAITLFDQLPRSIRLEGAVRVPAPAAKVWELVGNVGDGTVASDFVDKVELIGRGAGAVRHLHVKGGFTVSERIEEYSDSDRYYVYRVIDHGPTNFTHHLGATRVTPGGPEQCIVSWVTTAIPVTGHEEEARAMLQSNIDVVLAAILKRFTLATSRG
jgi:hypothetical protein